MFATTSHTACLYPFPSGDAIDTEYEPQSASTGGRKKPMQSIAWSPNRKLVGVVPFVGPAEIVSLEKNRLILDFIIEEVKMPTTIVFQNDSHVAVGTRHGTVVLYNFETHQIVKTYSIGKDTKVSHLTFSKNNTFLLAGCFLTNDIATFCIESTKIGRRFRLPDGENFFSLQVSSVNDAQVVVGGVRGSVFVTNLETNTIAMRITSHYKAVTAICFAPQCAHLLATVGLDGDIHFYNIRRRMIVFTIKTEQVLMSMAWAPSGEHFIVGTEVGNVCVYDLDNLTEHLNSFHVFDGPVYHLTFQPEPATNLSDRAYEAFVKLLSPEKDQIRLLDVASSVRASEIFFSNDETEDADLALITNDLQELQDEFAKQLDVANAQRVEQHEWRDENLIPLVERPLCTIFKNIDIIPNPVPPEPDDVPNLGLLAIEGAPVDNDMMVCKWIRGEKQFLD